MINHPASGPGGDLPPGPDAVPGAGARAGSTPVAPLPPELADPARTLFGDRFPLAAAYAELLATDGVLRGLVGPREASRIWARHLLNCAPVAELIPVGCSVLDVGSGAGLPGIVLAVARPDLSIVLVEPLARRTAFLVEVVAALDLARSVTVLRARAEELAGNPGTVTRSPGGRPAVGTGPAGEPGDLVLPADIVTARAVAPLDRLAAWCLPLTAPGGRLLALKGASAADEVAEHADAVGRLGGSAPIVRRCGVGVLDPPTTVVEIVRERVVGVPRAPSSRSAGVRRAANPPRRGRTPRR